jgi:hypothetical protein
MAKDLTPVPSPKGEGCLLAKVNALPALCFSGRLQSASGEELRPFVGRSLMPSLLGRAFKGEL